MEIMQHEIVNIVQNQNSAASNSTSLKATTLNGGTSLVQNE